MDTNCIMMACALHLPASLSGVIDTPDLTEYGIESSPHVTILYGSNPKLSSLDNGKIDRDELNSNIINIVGEEFLEFLRRDDLFNTLDLFDIHVFDNQNNDNDYLVLKLKDNTKIYEYVKKLHDGLKSYYNLESKYPIYIPHLTLAELNIGDARKYLDDKSLYNIIRDSKIGFEDIVISYNNDYTTYSVTTYHTVDRIFREDRELNDSKFI